MKNQTTRQKLSKVPNAPGLYRHESGTYYGIRKIKGKVKTASLETADRKLAERKLATWTQEQQIRILRDLLRMIAELIKKVMR